MVAVVLATLAFVLLPLLILFVLHELPFMGESFTPEKWTQAGGCEGLTDDQCVTKESSCPRGPMVQSLRRNHLAVGTGRDAVIKLLGAEDMSSDDRPMCLHWFLGMCSGLGWDYDSLQVCFDEADRLIESGHVQH
jgi:hypothetical protein